MTWVQKWMVVIGAFLIFNAFFGWADGSWHDALGWLVALSYTVSIYMYEEKYVRGVRDERVDRAG